MLRAHYIVTTSTSGRTSVDSHVFTEVTFYNHTLDQIRVVVCFIVDNSVDLSLYTNS